MVPPRAPPTHLPEYSMPAPSLRTPPGFPVPTYAQMAGARGW